MRLPNALALAGALCAASSAVAVSRPSFDCARARTKAEMAICTDPKLAALDRAVDAAYRAALRRLGRDRSAQQALREEQRWYVEGQEAARQDPGFGLGVFMASRRERLNQITGPRRGLEGAWFNGLGGLTVHRRPDGSFEIEAGATEWTSARWTCEYKGTGRFTGDQITVSSTEPDQGDRLTLRRQGAMLVVEEPPPDGTTTGPGYCGNGGHLSGTYFPAKPIPVRHRSVAH